MGNFLVRWRGGVLYRGGRGVGLLGSRDGGDGVVVVVVRGGRQQPQRVGLCGVASRGVGGVDGCCASMA